MWKTTVFPPLASIVERAITSRSVGQSRWNPLGEEAPTQWEVTLTASKAGIIEAQRPGEGNVVQATRYAGIFVLPRARRWHGSAGEREPHEPGRRDGATDGTGKRRRRSQLGRTERRK